MEHTGTIRVCLSLNHGPHKCALNDDFILVIYK